MKYDNLPPGVEHISSIIPRVLEDARERFRVKNTYVDICCQDVLDQGAEKALSGYDLPEDLKRA